MAYVGSTKILKQGGEKLDKFEESVSQVMCVCVCVVCRAQIPHNIVGYSYVYGQMMKLFHFAVSTIGTSRAGDGETSFLGCLMPVI